MPTICLIMNHQHTAFSDSTAAGPQFPLADNVAPDAIVPTASPSVTNAIFEIMCTEPRRTTRQIYPPSYLKGYCCILLIDKPPEVPIPYFFKNYIYFDGFSSTYKHFLLNVGTVYEPSFYHQAVKFPHWREAMDVEIKAIERTNTWTVVPLPKHNHCIRSKWVYKVKYKPDETVERYKARHVAKGYNQQEGVDFLDTFSPVAKIATVKVILTLAVTFNWPPFQMDVNNAFFNGDLFEEVYMALPLGYKASSQGEKMACHLNKSIYGLKQASRQWFVKFSGVLITHGFFSLNQTTPYSLEARVSPLLLYLYTSMILS